MHLVKWGPTHHHCLCINCGHSPILVSVTRPILFFIWTKVSPNMILPILLPLIYHIICFLVPSYLFYPQLILAYGYDMIHLPKLKNLSKTSLKSLFFMFSNIKSMWQVIIPLVTYHIDILHIWYILWITLYTHYIFGIFHELYCIHEDLCMQCWYRSHSQEAGISCIWNQRLP